LERNDGSLGKSKKGKLSKNMIKRTPSATFYTSKDDSTPYMIPSGEKNSLERKRVSIYFFYPSMNRVLFFIL
jgi:hypothetical protein